eukprot:TRINITY_DN40015_c0_g1_i1.p1 TRINITY_DN40015_c0_g1~~TRINITY_DN40015_c0_g1_i1.p1  ORF type:complete len:899 (-),score=116.80 TRINITY_DN40015_c0_g1_i1:7-2703(-)
MGGSLLESKPAAAAAGGDSLDEAELDRLAREAAHTSSRQGGPEERARAADARARCESELDRWRRAAEEAAEKGDFEECERCSTVAHRVGCLLQTLVEPPASNSASPAPEPSPPVVQAPAETISRERKRQSRSSRKGCKQKDGSYLNEGASASRSDHADVWNAFASGGIDFGAPPPFPAMSAQNPAPNEPWSMTGPSMTSHIQSIPDSSANGGQVVRGVGDAQSFAGKTSLSSVNKQHVGERAPAFHENMENSFCRDGREGGYASVDVGRCAQLEAQVQLLQTHNVELQAQLVQAQDQLGTAWQRFRQEQAEPMASAAGAVADAANTRVLLGSSQNVCRQLQAEVDQARCEQQQLRARLKDMEEQCAQKDSALTQARQRLFEEKRRSKQLEEDVKSGEEAQLCLKGKLHSERVRYEKLERDMLCLQHALNASSSFRNPFNRGSISGASAEASGTPFHISGSVGYSADRAAQRGSIIGEALQSSSRDREQSLPQVSLHDELASTTSSKFFAARQGAPLDSQPVTEAPLQRLARQGRGGEHPNIDDDSGQLKIDKGAKNVLKSLHKADDLSSVVCQASQGLLPKSGPNVWARAARFEYMPPALSFRTPSAPSGCAEKVFANFQKMLQASQGSLYEDQHVGFDLQIGTPVRDGNASCAEQCCGIVTRIYNHCGQPVHQIMLKPVDAGRTSPFRMLLTSTTGEGGVRSGAASSLWPREKTELRWEFRAFAPFEACPELELTYLLPDNLDCKARLRLPLLITRFMVPLSLPPQQFLDLWASPGFVQAELVFLCAVRQTLLEAGGYFQYAKSLELGGVLRPLPALEVQPRSAVLAASHSLHAGAGIAGSGGGEVLVRAELGDGACLITVRANDPVVSRGVAQALLHAIGREPGCAHGPHSSGAQR